VFLNFSSTFHINVNKGVVDGVCLGYYVGNSL